MMLLDVEDMPPPGLAPSVSQALSHGDHDSFIVLFRNKLSIRPTHTHTTVTTGDGGINWSVPLGGQDYQQSQYTGMSGNVVPLSDRLYN